MPIRPVRAVNFLLLLLYPASWAAPLARAGFLPWFSGDEVSILGGIAGLWEVDRALAVLVAAFAIAVPYGKTCLLAAVHLGRAGAPACCRWSRQSASCPWPTSSWSRSTSSS